MDAITLSTLRTLERAAQALDNIPIVMAQAYVGAYRNGIVDRHFTPGNQGRYGWPPLSFDYFKAKQGQKTKLRQGMKESGRKVSKLEKGAAAQYGTRSGVKGGSLPMLVRTGLLRDAVTNGAHRIERQGNAAFIVFTNLPEYALHLHTGTGKMPKRSPVEPNAEDEAMMQGEATKFIDRAIGTGGAVPVSGTTIPAVARFRPS